MTFRDAGYRRLAGAAVALALLGAVPGAAQRESADTINSIRGGGKPKAAPSSASGRKSGASRRSSRRTQPRRRYGSRTGSSWRYYGSRTRGNGRSPLAAQTAGTSASTFRTLSEGLVSWWPLDGNVRDALGENHGTIMGGVTPVPGGVQTRMLFDGSESGVTVPEAETLKPGPSLSITAWVSVLGFPTAERGLGQILCRGGAAEATPAYSLAVTPEGRLTFRIGAATTETRIETPIPTGRTIHVAATLDGATGLMRLYMDGKIAAETHTAKRPATDAVTGAAPAIGIGNTPGLAAGRNQAFHGYLDELRLYSRALSGAEVRALAKPPAAPEARAPGPARADKAGAQKSD